MIVRIVCGARATASAVLAQDWPGWLGPNGDGTTSSTAALHWDRETNVRWRVPLALPANGSPIVVGGRVFLTMPEDSEGKQRSLYCYDTESGEQLWVRTVDFGRVMPTHADNPYCGTTPAGDGQRVVVWHGSAGLFCYDVEGAALWNHDLGEFRDQWGYGTSPLLHADRVILHTGPGARSFVAAFDLETGEEIWRTEEPDDRTDEQLAQKRLRGSWSTPRIHRVGDRDLVLCGQPTRLVAYDAADGAIVWWCSGISSQRGDLIYSSPVVSGDVCFAVGGYVGPILGVRVDGEGDVTETHRLWHRPEYMSNCASGLAVDGHVFLPDMGSILSCIDASTGATTWRERVGRGGSWGSIVAAEGRLYLMTQDGTTVVFAPNVDELEVLARNALGEQTNSTPAIADGAIYLRTFESLYCIEAPRGRR